MKRRITVLGVCFLGLLMFSGCSKLKEIIDKEEKESGSANTLDILGIKDGDGIFVGIRSLSVQSTPIGEMEVALGTAVVAVGDLANGKFKEAGDVKCYVGSTPTAYTLTKQPNHTYVYMPGTTGAAGLESIPFHEGNAGMPFWEVNDLGISKGSYYRFPRKPELLSSLSITRSNGYEAQFRSNDGHELLVIISSGNEYVYKKLKSSDAAYRDQKVMFSAGELNVLPRSEQAQIQVVPYTVYTSSVSGKKYYFINQTVLSKPVTVN